ncbi:unnamed protein product [Didymodactylos carnosus]|uniref:YihY/virulence factor BrkB family protein n=1 Tax=Didymodactylos carnosus TaxID=1234261 RepID=A0A814S8G2_9BILA|nr:unnamed protein product [Didymodactylos carnosus]CAF1144618.1 unnamed protein product [Didymodactylos carnosus]CAF3870248.1 unnamed protein product [Didymodactylos carnosus]CAF3908212.1 unnamed protein product [Didymodactylos carnosus]
MVQRKSSVHKQYIIYSKLLPTIMNDLTSTLNDTKLFQVARRETKPYRQFFSKFMHDWSLDLAAMLAYNLLIALLPIAVALFGILAIILGKYSNFQDTIKKKIVNSFPDNTTREALEQVVGLAFTRLYHDAGFILAVGIIFAIFGSSRLFLAIDRCMTIIYRLQERTFLKQNLLALGMLFLFIILIPLMIAASSAPSFLLGLVKASSSRFGTYLAGLVTSLLISFVLFETIYFIIPHKKMTFKQTWCGSLVAAIALELFLILFPLYVRKFMTNYAGSIGFAVILLLFFYYFATILILGGQINAFFFEHIQGLPDGLGTFVHKSFDGYINDDEGDITTGKHAYSTREHASDENQNETVIHIVNPRYWWNKFFPSRVNTH